LCGMKKHPSASRSRPPILLDRRLPQQISLSGEPRCPDDLRFCDGLGTVLWSRGFRYLFAGPRAWPETRHLLAFRLPRRFAFHATPPCSGACTTVCEANIETSPPTPSPRAGQICRDTTRPLQPAGAKRRIAKEV
jgi:hypothetical protein